MRNETTRSFQRIVISAWIAVFWGCDQPREIVHPSPGLLGRDGYDSAAAFNLVTLAASEPSETPSPAREPVWIGVLNEPRAEAFGKVVAGWLGDGGRAYILDGHWRELRVFLGGSHEYSIGRKGGGPLEFRSPQSLQFASDETPVVFDSDGRITWIRDDRSQSVRTDLDIAGGCLLPNMVVLHTPSGPHPITVTDTLGDILYAFGRGYPSDNSIVRRQLSVGHVACFPEPETVIYANRNTGDVIAYSPEGELKWWRYIDGFRSVEIRETAGGTTTAIGRAGLHAIVAAVPDIDRSLLLVQAAFRGTKEAQAASSAHTTYVIDLGGNVRRASHGDYRILAWRGDRVLAVREPLIAQVGLLYRPDLALAAGAPDDHPGSRKY
jgi:hypothetical protein